MERAVEVALVTAGVVDHCAERGQAALLECARLASQLARGRLAVIPDAAHMAQYDNPRAWRAAIAAFLSEHDPAMR